VHVLFVHLGKLFVPVLQILEVFLVLGLGSLSFVAFAGTFLLLTYLLAITSAGLILFLYVYCFFTSGINVWTVFIFVLVGQGHCTCLEVSCACSFGFFAYFLANVDHCLLVVRFQRSWNLLEKA
jgi:hypothetical protein